MKILKDSVVIGRRDYTHGYFYRRLAFSFSVDKVCAITPTDKESAHAKVRQYWDIVTRASEALVKALKFKGEDVIEVRPAFSSDTLKWGEDKLLGSLQGFLIKSLTY